MCCTEFSSLKDKVICDVQETQDGVQITIKAKDSSKTESLKKVIMSGKDFCNCYII